MQEVPDLAGTQCRPRHRPDNGSDPPATEPSVDIRPLLQPGAYLGGGFIRQSWEGPKTGRCRRSANCRVERVPVHRPIFPGPSPGVWSADGPGNTSGTWRTQIGHQFVQAIEEFRDIPVGRLFQEPAFPEHEIGSDEIRIPLGGEVSSRSPAGESPGDRGRPEGTPTVRCPDRQLSHCRYRSSIRRKRVATILALSRGVDERVEGRFGHAGPPGIVIDDLEQHGAARPANGAPWRSALKMRSVAA